MTFQDYLRSWKERGVLSPAQHDYLNDVASGRIISVSTSIHGLFYVGVLTLVWSIGMLANQYYEQLGPFLIAAVLTALVLALGAYCFSKALPYSPLKVESPHGAFDYLVYLACALLVTDITFIETQFHLLGDSWRLYLLAGFILFTYLAYRFDNRLVLSLGIFKFIAFGWEVLESRAMSSEYYRLAGILGAALLWSAGKLSAKNQMKIHFQEVWEQFGLHLLLVSVVVGCADSVFDGLYFILLLLGAGVIAYRAHKAKKTMNLMFACLYFYVGLTVILAPWQFSDWISAFYFILSAVGLMAVIVKLIGKKGGEHD